jgi:plasmid stability protein
MVKNQTIEGESRRVTVRLPDNLATDIEARAVMHGITMSAEIVAMLEAGIDTTWQEDLPRSYKVTRERVRMQDRIDGHRLLIRDLRSQLNDLEEMRDAEPAAH